ncbi:MAG: class I SAM-dependent methyltransferase [Betaproteobacteria bacterium]|nr:class I SAM-dependent methyltransferase [Betaproteobacteria bacterium]
MHPEIGALIEAASRPYLAAGRYAYYFVRGKLTHDPVFIALLRSGCIPDRARVLDLGCGHAVLSSLLLAARERFEAGLWPPGWVAPPLGLRLLGIESERRTAQRAQITLENRATIRTADLRDVPLPDADVVVLIDILHYLETDAQVSLLERVAQSLRGGGLLILRVADISAGWRFHVGKAADRFGSLLTARAMPRHYHRRIDEWLHLLDSLGFEPGVEPNAAGQSFANVLVWAAAPAIGQA